MLPAATELVRRYADGSLSPVEVVRQSLDLIRRHEARVNAWVHVDDGPALATALASEARWRRGAPMGALDGVPVGVKDRPTRRASCRPRTRRWWPA